MTTVPALPLVDIAMPSLLTGLLGVVIVFVVLVVLSVVMGASRRKQEAEPAPVAPAAAPAPAPVAAAPAVAEPVKLIGVEEKEAAMIMAIVCDELQAPPEELYFKSIRLLDADAAQ